MYGYLSFLGCLLACGGMLQATAQPTVDVSVQLDTASIAPGESTTLRVLAQVRPELRDETSQIFSWYIDVTLNNSELVGMDPAAMEKTASDNHPQLSSNGQFSDGNLISIYDTFLESSGVGVTEPVELLSLPIEASAAGTVTFSVRAGTGVDALAHDFIVAPQTGTEPLVGGAYTDAFATLEIEGVELPPPPTLQASLTADGQLQLAFPTQPGFDYILESIPVLGGDANWTAVPNAPHNTGEHIISADAPHAFYRVRVVKAGEDILPMVALETMFTAQGKLQITFPTEPQFDYILQASPTLGPKATWTDLPNAPHNSGEHIVPTGQSHQFYRLRIE